MEYRPSDPPVLVDIERSFNELLIAKRLVLDAEKKLEVVKWGRETYYNIFGRSEQKEKDVQWQEKVLERCKQIRATKLEIYYQTEKQYENE